MLRSNLCLYVCSVTTGLVLNKIAKFETGYLETHIHSVHCRVFMLDSPKLISRKLLPKISFHLSHQRKTRKSWTYNDVAATTTTTKQYEHIHNNQFYPIILALPHPITVLLWMLLMPHTTPLVV